MNLCTLRSSPSDCKHSCGETKLKVRWWSHHLETEASSFEQPIGKDRRKKIWKLLARSEELDRFLGKKFPNLKRYGVFISLSSEARKAKL